MALKVIGARALEETGPLIKRVADINPPRTPKRKRKVLSPDQLVLQTYVFCPYSIVGVKELSELALCAVGQFLWETHSLSLEDYQKLEFLQWRLSGGRVLSDIRDERSQRLCLWVQLLLKYAERTFEPNRPHLTVERLNEVFLFKTGNCETLSYRSHRTRSAQWAQRLNDWVVIRTISSEEETSRGTRYSSYTKGYHDGSTLRPPSPESDQILDRGAYSQQRFGTPNLEVWDPEEFRRNL